MNTRRIPPLALVTITALAAAAAASSAETVIVNSADATVTTSKVSIRPNDIRSWKSVDQRSLVITTRNHQRYLVELKRSCNNLHGSLNDAALYTNEHSRIDDRGAIRIVPRDRLDRLFDHQSHASVDFAMDMEANSDYCPIKQITALGREDKKKT